VLRHYPKTPPAGYVPFPREAIEGSLIERFEAQVERNPAQIALRTPSSQWSYAELNASANRVAHGILSSSGSDRTPVAVLMDQEGPSIPSLLGVLKTGRPYVFLDPNDPPTRWESILNLTGTDTLITTGHAAAQLKTRVNSCRLLVYEELDAAGDTRNPGLDVGPDHLAAIFFTSGSTGEPKGVPRDHRQILHAAWFNTSTYFISPKDRHSLLYFPGFGASVFCFFDMLLNGATICALNPRRMTPSDLVTWVRTERITIFSPPIGIWRNFVEAIPPGTSWPDLRQITLAGQSIYGSDVREFQSRFDTDTVLCFMLAMTEAGIVTHGYLDHSIDPGDGPIPPGYPVAGKDIAIVDDAGRPVAPGQRGRIAITSVYISSCYWRDEARTRQCFHQDTADPRRTTFLTGDRGRFLPDGCLEYFGREDSVVKVRGYRVDLGAVEAVLNSHPSVHGAAIVAGQWHGHEPALAAYVVPRAGMSPALTELRTFIAGKLPAYMVPRHIQFLEAMPLTPTGKINRRALPAPGRFRPELEAHYVAPRNETEARIAAIWSDLLDLGDVGVMDDFFELGGDSLQAMRMAMAVEQALHRPVPAEFFRSPTIDHLALMMADGARDPHADRVDAGHANPAQRAKAGSHSLRRGVKAVLSAGPVWREHALPYGVGIHLQRALVAQPAVRRHFSARLSLLREWADRLGIVADVQELGTIALLANTWKAWRAQALSHPDAIGRWLHISDPHGYLRGASGSSAGVVLATPHTGGLSLPVLAICRRNGLETASVMNAPWLGENDGSADWAQRQTRARSKMIWKAQQVLLRGGVACIAADGLNGRQSVEIDFWGSRRPFRVGAAELAVSTGAAFVPVYTELDAEGRVHVDVASGLTTDGAGPQERIEELTRRYGLEYAARWPRFFASMIWKHLEYNLRPTPETARLL
jgi:amino acid adenylation domain-containing protein